MSTPAPASATVPQRTSVVSMVVGSATFAAVVAALLIAWIASDAAGAAYLPFSSQALGNIAQVLTPLVMISLFIERAVEVVISAWRDHGAAVRRAGVEHAQPGSEKFAQMALDTYKLETQRLSFIVSATLALAAALIGVRAIQPLLDALPQGIDAAQRLWIMRVDVVITALLLAGGADGIHQIVTTFTDFLDNTKQRMNPSPVPANAAPSTLTQTAVTQTTATQTTVESAPAPSPASDESGAAG